MKAYLEYLRSESKGCFEQGQTSLEASKRIDLGRVESPGKTRTEHRACLPGDGTEHHLGSIYYGKRMRNGWKNSGLPWTY